jgi:FkbM family methyltransferase
METIHIQLPNGGQRPFFHRGSPADLGVIRQMFQNHDYSLSRLQRGKELQALYESLARGGKKPFILDAGANIGASVCWFAISFPESHIAAFEPDAANFELLRRNTTGLNVDPQNAALGAADGKASIVDPGLGEWGYRAEIDMKGPIELCSISRIVSGKCSKGLSPFIAKIDIEGGEKDLFREPNNWINQFPLLIVELHDWLLPRQGTSRSFLECISKADRDFVHVGENIFSIRNS